MTMNKQTIKFIRKGLFIMSTINNTNFNNLNNGVFTHLHLHTTHSLLDGLINPSELAQQIKSDGGVACAITDHGTMSGVMEFEKAMKKEGVKPIFGCEFYHTKYLNEEDLVKVRGGETSAKLMPAYHVVMLAKNETGYKNLLKLHELSQATKYRKAQVVMNDFEAYSEGVIALSACAGGIIPRAIAEGDFEEAMKIARLFKGIYGEDFYLEIQRHGIEIEDVINNGLVMISKNLRIELVATCDSHFLNAQDKYAHEGALCIATKKTMNDPTHFKFEGEGYHVLSQEEATNLFADIPSSIANTKVIADKCEEFSVTGDLQMPVFPVPAPFVDEASYFTYVAKEGFKTRFEGTWKETSQEYLDRFSYEMEIIEKMGFQGYFLIVQDYIKYARDNDIYVGPGRGSAAGSLVVYCLGITDMDPITFNLLFERFLNPDRISMPDIDTDFEHKLREKVIKYTLERYGKENTCGIATYGTLAAKMVCKDVSKVLGYSVEMGNLIARHIPNELGMTLPKAIEENPELSTLIESNHDVKQIIEMALKLEGTKRHSSQHACGFIIAPSAVSNFAPVVKMQGELVAQFTMSECEEAGLLKMDLLGLKNMTVIHDALRMAERNYGKEEVLAKIKSLRDVVKYQDIPLNDRATYQMLAKGLTGGVFQLESPGMTKTIVEMIADIDTLSEEEITEQCFERLIAVVALYRPGPMDSIPDYIAGMRDQSKIHYDHESLKEILAPTYGVIVYQEQVIQIVKSLAGFSGGQADDVRKAMGKKIIEKMEKAHKIFIHGNKEDFDAGEVSHYAPGCVANGIPEDVATVIWNKMAEFAKYAFNRSHAACYAWIAYLTAFLSCHWTPEFYAAMLTTYAQDADKFKEYLSQATLRGVKIVPPSVNNSGVDFDVKDGSILYSLQGIKAVNSIAEVIVAERNKNGAFTNPDDFLSRVSKSGGKCPKGTWNSLSYSGALDCFGHNRKEMIEAFPALSEVQKINASAEAMGQFCLYSKEELVTPIAHCRDFTEKQKLSHEYDVLGLYISGHPIDEALSKLTVQEAKNIISVDAFTQDDCSNNDRVSVLGQVKNAQTRFTKNGDTMCSLVLQGRFKDIKCVIFPKQYQSIGHISVNAIIAVHGKFNADEAYGNQIIVDSVSVGFEHRKEDSLTITVTDKESQTKVIALLKGTTTGDTRVYLKTPDSDVVFPLSVRVNKSLTFLDSLSDWQFISA